MLTIENLSFEYNSEIILRSINLSIKPNQKIGLVGVNGAGKSTLLKLIVGILTPTLGSISYSPDLKIGYLSQVIDQASLLQKVSTWQFLLSGRSLPFIEQRMTEIYDQLSHSKQQEYDKLLAELENLIDKFELNGGYQAEFQLLKIIKGMNLEQIDLSLPLTALSGGQKTKIAFARLLYSNPDLLLLDEPTNYLDSLSRVWIMEYLKNSANAVICVSHDTEFLDSFTQQITNIDEFTHQIQAFQGNYSEFVRQLTIQKKLEANEYKKVQREKAELQEYLNRMANVSGKRKRQVGSRKKRFENLEQAGDLKPRDSRLSKFELSVSKKGAKVPLKLRDLSFSYNTRPVISNLCLEIARDERWVIIGKNGAGKTTLLKLISGNLDPCSGKIIYGKDVSIGYYSQELESFNSEISILEDFLSACSLNQQFLRSFLGRFLFTQDKVSQKINTLSPGERSRLAIAKIVLQQPNLLILDEPTNHLDVQTQKVLAENLAEYGGTMIIVSHEITFLDLLGIEKMLVLPEMEIDFFNPGSIENYRD